MKNKTAKSNLIKNDCKEAKQSYLGIDLRIDPTGTTIIVHISTIDGGAGAAALGSHQTAYIIPGS
jgi:hypothetical protein